jgi:hypothetical protein
MDERAHELPEPEPVAAPVAAPSPAAAPLARSPHGFGCGCGACSRSLSPDAVLALQRGAGQRRGRPAPRGPAVRRARDRRPRLHAAREARDAWIAGGRRGPRDHAPSTGRGGFEASYHPMAQQLVIELRGGVECKDGMHMCSGAGSWRRSRATSRQRRPRRRSTSSRWISDARRWRRGSGTTRPGRPTWRSSSTRSRTPGSGAGRSRDGQRRPGCARAS